MRTLLVPPTRFSGDSKRDAHQKASEWLSAQLQSGLSPLHLVATGDSASLLLSGLEGGAIVFIETKKK